MVFGALCFCPIVSCPGLLPPYILNEDKSCLSFRDAQTSFSSKYTVNIHLDFSEVYFP